MSGGIAPYACKDDAEPSPKRRRLEEASTTEEPQRDRLPEASSSVTSETEPGLPPFEEFAVEEVLHNSARTKAVTVTGRFSSRPELCAVILAEKQPLSETDLQTLFAAGTTLTQSFQNDIYAQYTTSCPNGVGALKLQTVYPAADAHIRKYSVQPYHLFQETPEDYEKITKRFIEKEVLRIEVHMCDVLREQTVGLGAIVISKAR